MLKDYELISGQKVIHSKSCFLSHASLLGVQRRVVTQITGFHTQSFPVKYLGCPLYSGRRKKSYFSALCTAVVNRMLSWNEKLLSYGGKLVLIQSVLSVMPTHILALCKPYEEGDVGLRSLQHVFDAFSLKWWWKFRQRQSLWAEFMHSKYILNLHPCYSEACPGQSATWRRMLDAQLVAERHIRWIVGSGNSSFWHDNWLGSGLLCRQVKIFQEQPVADFVVHGGWNVQRLYQVLPMHCV
ncbi:uncharacterized protein LOC113758084 [Coffea eugenioides]|uniref:uncharacterized protein LOC113758084 n=1 Tax=Coffea eugenioides TaxID=49369 RepID=UPI000F6057F2|nr:uncharacterized protein LOC113758084 [Coffea eugenioides]